MLKLQEFRAFMRKINVDAFILHTRDEYLNEYSENLVKLLCGFSGENGLLIITKNDKCPFFTDIRYIIQAYDQLDQDTFQIYDVQEYDPSEWIKENLTLTVSVGYYLQYLTLKEIRKYKDVCKLVPFKRKEVDYKKQKIVSHMFGESSRNKCNKIIKNISDEKVDAVFLTDPNSISWLLNLRNENAKYTPCVLGRAILYKNGNVDLFVHNKNCSSVEANIESHINIFDLSELEKFLCKLDLIMIDPTITPASMIKDKKIIEREDPCLLYKAVKNQIEVTGSINAHIRDGAAVTNFLCWLEANINNKITELDAEEKLLEYRKKQYLFKQPSFPTISAFNENGAIIHYNANSQTNKIIQRDGLYLIDSGGQYLDGTTDVTRTIAIGNPTNEQINYYTVVLKAHIALANAVFPLGTTGGELDILARIHLWKLGIDYMHSTGHGVGSYLSVHEGPQAISKGNNVKLIPGMILSNEPGYYIPRMYGIRIENLMCIKEQKNGFLSFKQLTSIPYDKKLIDVRILTRDEISWIDSYHQFVYKNLKDSIKNKKWLKKMCSSLYM
ncbi:MAG: aminopeptidase P family protein [Wolbachia endosymbiont of Menacanthus eurysternus]|nr:MAG: aminopeptidase P family protein [Wolbachia endosymbiont of Menacanthus eurysternus]